MAKVLEIRRMELSVRTLIASICDHAARAEKAFATSAAKTPYQQKLVDGLYRREGTFGGGDRSAADISQISHPSHTTHLQPSRSVRPRRWGSSLSTRSWQPLSASCSAWWRRTNRS